MDNGRQLDDDAWSMVGQRSDDDAWSTVGQRRSTTDQRRPTKVDGRMLDGWMLGWSTTDGWMTTDDDRPTTTDARCVQREANTDDLAAVRANGFSGVFFFFFFP